MDDFHADIMNKLVACGGWLRRAIVKFQDNSDPIIFGEIREALDANESAIKLLKERTTPKSTCRVLDPHSGTWVEPAKEFADLAKQIDTNLRRG